MMRERLNFLAVALLAAGLAAAALVWQAQDRIDRQNAALQAGDAGAVNSADPLPPADFRKHVRQVEIYYGQLGLVTEQLSDWAAGTRKASRKNNRRALSGGGRGPFRPCETIAGRSPRIKDPATLSLLTG